MRPKFETQLDLLLLISEGAAEPTEMMAALYLSLRDLRGLTGSLVKNGLLEDTFPGGFSRERYTLTPKGERVLNYFRKKDDEAKSSRYPWYRIYNPFQDLRRLRATKY
jgi:predicted transcriptional regulator